MFHQAASAMFYATGAAAPAATATVPFDITQVLQFGLLGLIFLCLVFRKFIVPEWTLKAAEEHATAEKDELIRRLGETREQLDKLQDVFQDQMIPALTKATEINARYTDELQKARYARKDPSMTESTQ
jgi:hypothetical protein